MKNSKKTSMNQFAGYELPTEQKHTVVGGKKEARTAAIQYYIIQRGSEVELGILHPNGEREMLQCFTISDGATI